MPKPKRVAIIGAGPSGLAMAKSLLQNFPPGTFSPVVFEKKPRIGGLWAVDYPSPTPGSTSATNLPSTSEYRSRGFVDPWMKTNLSRFSVAFSDLSWETALGRPEVPAFPCAWEVRRYLEKYAEVYIPRECLGLGRRVLKVVRRENGSNRANIGWNVSWTDDKEGEDAPVSNLQDSRVQTDEFDFLVVASGHFGTPSIPNIPGLKGFPSTVHSSNLQNADDIRSLVGKSPKGGKLVVIGGSMSGVEAASSLALHVSSLNFGPGSAAQSGKAYEVWHVSTGPFWVLPTYLPHQYAGDSSKGDSIPFVPLDLSLYDLGRRPPGMSEFAFGPVSPEQISKRNQFFRAMLGKNYGEFGGIDIADDQGKENERAPWVGIADNYAEFIRSEVIKPLPGRACSVAYSDTGLGTIDIQTPIGVTSLTDVAAIVVATGFKPSDSLSFLPQDILSTLEYSKDDYFLPLVLDNWSSAHSEIPDLGFVGFYRGAFWGPAELQAQNLAQSWANIDLEYENPVSLSARELRSRATERQRVREFRDFRPAALRGQFPLGDYVGLMGSLARRVNRTRIPIEIGPGVDVQPIGPVVPARYPPCAIGQDTQMRDTSQKEVDITMKALNSTLSADPVQACVGTTAAIFRALHGQWNFERIQNNTERGGEVISLGRVTFYPRYQSCPDFGAEYLCKEIEDGDSNTASMSVYRLPNTSRHPKQTGISVWSVNEGICANAAGELVSELHVGPVGKTLDSGEILVKAGGTTKSSLTQEIYEFYFDRVAIARWSHHLVPSQKGVRVSQCTTQYSRPADA